MSRPRGPNLARSPLIREVIDLVDGSDWMDWQIEMVAGCANGYISQLRNGHRHGCSAPILDAILGCLGKRLAVTPANYGKPRGNVKRPKKPAQPTRRKAVQMPGRAREGIARAPYAGQEAL